MKKTIFTILFALCATLIFGQTTAKVTLISDSIVAMGVTNGKSCVLLPPPGTGKVIFIQDITIKYNVNKRLYSPDNSTAYYLIGYQGNGFQEVARLNFGELNANSNTNTYSNVSMSASRWNEADILNAPLMIKFDRPMNFEGTGTNRIILYITYQVLN